jgi:hypothetical protein
MSADYVETIRGRRGTRDKAGNNIEAAHCRQKPARFFISPFRVPSFPIKMSPPLACVYTAYCIIKTRDGGYALVGQTWSEDLKDFWLVKTDSSGNIH